MFLLIMDNSAWVTEAIQAAIDDHSNYQHIERGGREKHIHKQKSTIMSEKNKLWLQMSSVTKAESMKAAHVFPGSHINLLITQTRLVSSSRASRQHTKQVCK